MNLKKKKKKKKKWLRGATRILKEVATRGSKVQINIWMFRREEPERKQTDAVELIQTFILMVIRYFSD